jgi:chemosensory pili system protein ChpA (sensor histidine kinase/response regulator)
MINQQDMDLAEAQLQQELRSMFDVDAQTYLRSYINLVEGLNANSWTADIQEMYRAIHTIKGGAVTVGADAILHISTALEDLLSDLRYLQSAPPLEDGKLTQMLLEAGELLTVSIDVRETGEEALMAVYPSVERLLFLRKEIQQIFLPEMDEHTQLCQEFAEQGFDLVVLDFEMALEQLPESGVVPKATQNAAKETLRQLLQIGKDLEMAEGWRGLLNQSAKYLTKPDSSLWRSECFDYLKQLKECAKRGGKLLPVKVELPPEPPQEVEQPVEVTGANRPNSNKPTEAASNIQVPIPLERLNQSANYLVETLMAARLSQGHYQNLNSQLDRLVTLAQDNVNYIAELRQVQNDYALMENLQKDRNSNNGSPTIETYRKGYIIINRLLESSLRLSEVGAEAAMTSRQTVGSLQTLDRNLFNLQKTIEESRLVPFKSLAFRVKSILRDLSNRFNKPVNTIVRGEKFELDVRTNQALEPTLLHLIRNSFDHGLESPEVRRAKGKPEKGTIAISLRRVGNYYRLTIEDDGGGIDAQKIAKIAEEKRMPLTDTSTPAKLLATICQPGFSSKTDLSDISGRGVGMDVVLAQVKSLDGTLSLTTEVGVGSTFTIQLPVPQLLVRTLTVRVGDRIFAIPSEEIITTTLWEILVDSPQAKDKNGSMVIVESDGTQVPIFDMWNYWQQDTSGRILSDTALCLKVRSLSVDGKDRNREIWLVVDDSIEQIELLINSIPAPLIPPIGLIGFSLLNDGKLIPVLETASIAEKILHPEAFNSEGGETENLGETGSSRDFDRLFSQDSEKDTGFLVQTILVVDDAALIRRRMEVSLTNHGYIVHTCRDGVEALTWLKSHPLPSLIMTDIEMPNMDGFTLTTRCRQEGIETPILVVSSRVSEEWNREAKRVGATDYLNKGFTTPELIAKVNGLLQQI